MCECATPGGPTALSCYLLHSPAPSLMMLRLSFSTPGVGLTRAAPSALAHPSDERERPPLARTLVRHRRTAGGTPIRARADEARRATVAGRNAQRGPTPNRLDSLPPPSEEEGGVRKGPEQRRGGVVERCAPALSLRRGGKRHSRREGAAGSHWRGRETRNGACCTCLSQHWEAARPVVTREPTAHLPAVAAV